MKIWKTLGFIHFITRGQKIMKFENLLLFPEWKISSKFLNWTSPYHTNLYKSVYQPNCTTHKRKNNSFVVQSLTVIRTQSVNEIVSSLLKKITLLFIYQATSVRAATSQEVGATLCKPQMNLLNSRIFAAITIASWFCVAPLINKKQKNSD